MQNVQVKNCPRPKETLAAPASLLRDESSARADLIIIRNGARPAPLATFAYVLFFCRRNTRLQFIAVKVNLLDECFHFSTTLLFVFTKKK